MGLCAGSPGAARAADCTPLHGLSPCIDSDNLWPHAGGGPYFAVGDTTTAPRGTLSFGIVGSYLTQPIGVNVASPNPAGSTTFLVDQAFDATLLFALGMTDRLELTLAAPATLYQSGAGLSTLAPSAPLQPRSAVRDMRFGFAAALLERPRTGPLAGPALTGRLEFDVPTGSDDAFAHGPTAVLVPSLVFSYRLGRVDISAEAFARLRGAATFANAVVGPQVGGAVGTSVDILKDRWLGLGAEAFALYTTSKQLPDPLAAAGSSAPPLVPAEWIAHVSTAHFFGGDLVLALGGGTTIPQGSTAALTSPRYRLDFSLRYAPTGRDSDGDGVLDRDDRCPDQPGRRWGQGPQTPGTRANFGCPDKDSDGDGILDEADQCPSEPGPVENHGCPDKDSDGDGIPDRLDKCPDEPEDFDGYEDHDGCPELDNDGDGIPDVVDKCPNEPEDFDGYQDADGCPDPDNDGDGIPDALDKCPDEPEDFDGFQDADGCPDLDNDQDGIPDALDKCPNEPETINGFQDADGCPEPGQKSLVHWSGNRVTVDAPARFTPGKAEPPAALAKQLRMVAQLVLGRAPLASVILEAYPDRERDTSVKALELAAARAEAVKALFVAAGVPAAVITAAAANPTAKRAPGAPALDVTVLRRSRPAARRPKPRPNPGASTPR